MTQKLTPLGREKIFFLDQDEWDAVWNTTPPYLRTSWDSNQYLPCLRVGDLMFVAIPSLHYEIRPASEAGDALSAEIKLLREQLGLPADSPQ